MTTSPEHENIRVFISLQSNKETEFAKKIKQDIVELSSFSQFFDSPERNIMLHSHNELLSEYEFEQHEKLSLDDLQKKDAILFTHVDHDGNSHVLDVRYEPEAKYDWMKVIEDFLTNIKQDTVDDNGYYKWGQLAPQDGEYMCVDCGFILELQKGDMFPICEVCLSGDPSAPDAKSDEGYWELV